MGQRPLHEGDVIGAGQLLEAERFLEVAEADVAQQRDLFHAEVYVLQRHRLGQDRLGIRVIVQDIKRVFWLEVQLDAEVVDAISLAFDTQAQSAEFEVVLRIAYRRQVGRVLARVHDIVAMNAAADLDLPLLGGDVLPRGLLCFFLLLGRFRLPVRGLERLQAAVKRRRLLLAHGQDARLRALVELLLELRDAGLLGLQSLEHPVDFGLRYHIPGPRSRATAECADDNCQPEKQIPSHCRVTSMS